MIDFSSGEECDAEERSDEWKIISIGISSQQQQQFEQDTTDSTTDIPTTRMQLDFEEVSS